MLDTSAPSSLHLRFTTYLRTGADGAEAGAPPAEAALEARLGELLAAGRAAWPALSLSDDELLRYLAERIPEGSADLIAALDALNSQDLHLCCACALDRPHALQAFEQRCFAGLPAALSRLSTNSAFHDEVRQAVRARLFVSEPGARRRIEDYAGRGPLAGWVRIVAIRLAVDLLREGGRQPLSLDDEALQNLTLGADPELGALAARYRDEVQAAFRAAFAALSAAERNLLRLHHLDGLTVDDLAALKRLHRSTVARRIVRCREQIAAHTRDALVERLGLDPAQVESVIRLVRSQLDLSLDLWLRKGPPRG